MRNSLPLILLLSLGNLFAQDFVLPKSGSVLPVPLKRSMDSIHSSALAAHIGFLASPALEGRGLGARGLDAAAEYIAAQLALMKIRPFGDRPGSYFQPVPLREISRAKGRILVEKGAGKQVFQAGVDWVMPEVEPRVLAAPLVFAGYGVCDEALHYDDLQGLDVKGKLVVIRDGLPTPELLAKYGSEDPEDRYASRVEAFAKLGAKALLVIEEGLYPKPAEEAPYYLSTENNPEECELPLFRVSAAMGAAILEGRTTPGPLSDISLRIEITGEERAVTSRNAIGSLPGTDPEKPSVILGAHMDHLGIQGGVIHPGADDNASGVSALLEIARAFSASPHRFKRTLIFAFWTGEEEAKFGSTYYVHHHQWRASRLPTYLNLDMIGHPWSGEEIRKLLVDARIEKPEAFLSQIKPSEFAEPGFPPGDPELEAILKKAGQGNGLALHLDRTDGRSGGSDYRAFARAGVPFVRFFGNFFPAYHKPGDTPENLDPSQVRKLARMAFATAWMLAER